MSKKNVFYSCILAVLSLFSALNESQARIICTATLNSANEKKVFQHYLNNPNDRFFELTDLAPRGDWFQRACDSGIQCDALLISAHFADRFFGTQATSVDLEQMEMKSCQNTCSGVLGAKNVYLFGCNTLAGKQTDGRTLAEYLQILRKEGQALADAEGLAAMRYGPLGNTYEDRVRRIFSHATEITGFSMPAPTGADLEPLLIRGFQETQERSHSSVISDLSSVHFKVSGIETTSGLPASSSLSCELTDNSTWISDRIEMINRESQDPHFDFAGAIPSILRFFHTVSLSGKDERENEALLALKQNETLRSHLLMVLNQYKNDFPNPKLRFAAFLRQMDWMTASDFAKVRYATLEDLLREPKIQSESADFICETQKLDSEPIPFPKNRVELSPLTQDAKRALSCIRLQTNGK